MNLRILTTGAVLEAALICVSAGASEELFTSLDANSDGQVVAEEVSSNQRRLFDRLVRRGDRDGDRALTLQEFEKSLVPDTPPKPIETKRPDSFRGANETRLLLLMLDTTRDGRISKKEVPGELKSAFGQLLPEIDTDKNGELSGRELTRGGQKMARRAARIVRGLDLDVEAELKKYDRKQGEDAKRFDRPFEPMRAFSNPKRTKALFAELDVNSDGRIVLDELPTPLQGRFKRVIRRGDRNRDGGLSQNEFMSVAKRLGEYLKRQSGGSPSRTENSTSSSKKMAE